MTIIISIITFILGFITSNLIRLLNKRSDKEKYLRKGLYNNSYSISSKNKSTEQIDVQFELAEIERSKTKSKVKVIELKTSNANYNKGYNHNRIKSMVDMSWIESSNIEWIEEPIYKIRDEKINKILNYGK
jgi:hypothetical protein